MTNPCKIDARKSNATNIKNDAKMEIEIHQKYMKTKQYQNTSRKMIRPKAIGLEGPRARSAGKR